MPWSPVPKFPEVMEVLRKKGYVNQVNLGALRCVLIEKLGMTSETTIRRTIKILEELNYIHPTENCGVWNIEKNRVAYV